MCKFYKDTQTKTPIRNLFEQMFDIERRLTDTVTQQENMVQIILDIILKFAKNCIEGNDAEIQLKSFLQYFNQFEIFNELLLSTKNLQNDLNTMRVYCNRLVVIEDERNAIGKSRFNLRTINFIIPFIIFSRSNIFETFRSASMLKLCRIYIKR